jgi:hypothetical protein
MQVDYTFLNSSAHSVIVIFWIVRAWPDAGPDDCVCAKRARHDERAAPASAARLGSRRRSIACGTYLYLTIGTPDVWPVYYTGVCQLQRLKLYGSRCFFGLCSRT